MRAPLDDNAAMSSTIALAFEWEPFSRGDSGIRFQRMGTDLLADVLGIANLTLGPTHPGRDGGNDGWYDGEIEGVYAHWKIAFAVRAEFATLETKARAEHKSGVADNAEAILLCTPLDLNVDQTREIGEIVGHGLKKGLCWPKSKLEHHLRNAPWVASIHFGLQFLPGFVPLNSASELEIATQQDVPILGRADALASAASFMTEPDRVLLVIAPGGAGKSRFLRELHENAASSALRSSWLRRIGRGTIEDAILRGLPRRRPLLLCMDDAGLDLNEALELARLSNPIQGGADAKVVLAGRVPDQFLLEKVCREAKITFSVIRLEPLGLDFAMQLAVHECPGLGDQAVGALLRFSGGNLFLLRAAAQLIAAGTRPSEIIDQQYLRGLLVDRLVLEATRLLSPLGVSEPDTRKLLLRAALDAPLDASTVADDERIATLRTAAVLRVVGNGVRFRADVEGDLLLGHLTREPWAQVHLRQQLEAQPERMPGRLRNLAAAGDGYPADVVRKACADWIASAATTTAFARRRIMRVLPHAVAVAPAEVCALCQQYVSIAPPAPVEPLERAFGVRGPTTDDFGPVVLALARNGHHVAAVTLARLVYAADVREGQYSNFKVEMIGAEIVSPLFSPPSSVEAVLDEIERWTTQVASVAPSGLIKSVLSAVLAGTFPWSKSTAAEFTYGEVAFSDTLAVRRMRERAIRVLQQLLHHPDAQLRLTACHVFDDLGRGGGMAGLADELRPIIEQEVATMIPHIAQRLDLETDFAVIDELEGGLLERWAAERPGAEASVAVLSGRNWPVLYRAYQLVHRPGDWKRQHDDVFAAPPKSDRWGWWVERSGASLDMNEVQALAESLHHAYTDAARTLEALRVIANGPHLFLLLDPWCALAQSLFVELQDRADVPPELREVIARALRRISYRNDPARVTRDLRAILDSANEHEIERLLEDSSPLPLLERCDVARTLVGDERVSLRARGFRLAFLATDLTAEQGIEILTTALRDGEWLEHWNVVWHALTRPMISARIPGSALQARLAERLVEALASLAGNWGGNTSWYLSHTISKFFDSPAERLNLVEIAIAGGGHIRDVGALLGPLASSAAALPNLAAAISRWLAEGWISGVAGVSDLINTALTRETLTPTALALGRSLCSGADENAKIVGVVLLSELRDVPDACVDVVEACAGGDAKLAEAAKRVVYNFCRTRGAYSAEIGRPPPALEDIDSLLIKAEGMCRTPEARLLLTQMRALVQDDLARHARQDEELLDPHR